MFGILSLDFCPAPFDCCDSTCWKSDGCDSLRNRTSLGETSFTKMGFRSISRSLGNFRLICPVVLRVEERMRYDMDLAQCPEVAMRLIRSPDK